MAGDPYWNSVVLAMHMDGANASTVFTDQKGKTVTAVGNAQISTAQSKFGGASALFDGTGDACTIPYGDFLELGAGDFTIELFVRPSATAAKLLVSRRTSGASIAPYLVYFDATNKPSALIARSDGGAWLPALTATTSVSIGAWAHIAFVRYGRVLMLYVNGVAESTVPIQGSLMVGTSGLAIGSDLDVATSFFGHVDDLRITKGVARYTANFTPAAAAFPNAPAMISGTVKDSANAFAPRAVRVHRKSDGALSGAVTSHATTGAFSVPALDASPHYALVHDSDADPYWANVVLATHFDTDSVIDPYMSSVVLGLHMEGANAATVFQDVTGKTVTAVGNAQLSTATANFGGSSAYFDGTGDYLSVPDASDLRMGASQFTLEGWMYCTGLPTTGNSVVLVQKGYTTGSTHEYSLRLLNTSGVYTLVLDLSTSGTAVTTSLSSSAVTPSVNTWFHVAAARNTTTVYFFFNGTLSGSTANTSTLFGGTGITTVGAATAGASCVTGYIDDLRITKGVARYTAAFTPPTVPFSSFKDLTGKDILVNGGPSINTTTKKYGDASMYFDGTGDYLSVAAGTALVFGAGDFTIEAWVYYSNVSAARMIYDGRNASQTSGVAVYMSAAAKIVFYTSVADRIVGTTSMTTGAWWHIAVCKSSGVIKMYVNGVQEGSAYADANNYSDSLVTVGADRSGGGLFMQGYIDDLRITKGVARYQADFTPPERAFAGAMTAGVNNALIFDDLTPV